MNAFHPHENSKLLKGCDALHWKAFQHAVKDESRADYVSRRLLRVALLAYTKHHMGIDIVGWDKLGDELRASICEAVGDDAFMRWGEKLRSLSEVET